MTTTNNVFPGVIDTAMPAFISNETSTDSCRVYFGLSKYNSYYDEDENTGNVKGGSYLQVSVRDQNTNTNLVSDISGIVMKEPVYDSSKQLYYFTLTASDLIDNKFEQYVYYKIQFRLTDIAASNKTGSMSISEWLQTEASSTTVSNPRTNLDESSEWSTVCLIRGIAEPTVVLETFDDGSELDGLTEIKGYLDFAETDKDEYLRSYKITILQNDSILESSNEIFTKKYGNRNLIEYTCKSTLGRGDYTIKIEYTTNNLYSNYDDFDITIAGNSYTAPTPSMESIDEEGIVKISFTGSLPSAQGSSLIVFRSDSRSNYEIWDKIVEKSDLYPIYDNTIESGILYKYATAVKINNISSTKTISTNKIGIALEHMFLTTANKQLKIKFNPTVSSIKTNILENKIDTIGSVYPFIRRNGAVKYKSFPISGLITHFMDEENNFSSREEIYGENNLNDYNNFNADNEINYAKDYDYERLFREKVNEFLIDGQVKLFRSPIEGNILIRLMDINFTPNTQLGRLVWTFSATAYEVGEVSIENLNKYNLITINDMDHGENNYQYELNRDNRLPYDSI